MPAAFPPGNFPAHARQASYPAGPGGMPGQQPFLRPPVQGFPAPDSRRLSSTTISTTTTGTNLTADFVAPLPGNRAATVPNRASVQFPSPQLASGSNIRRAPSAAYSVAPSVQYPDGSPTPPQVAGSSRYSQSDLGHGDKRFSSMTTATFGNWDAGLQSAMGPGSTGLVSCRYN